MLKSFRYLLFPLALVYWVILSVRNWLFDKHILTSAAFNFPLICIGNLAVGGTGKTPMAEYLIRLLQTKYNTATLSRGYKRKTRGYSLATENTSAIQIGDEPMQLHEKFPEVTIAVGEERIVAIPQLLQDKPDTDVIILDDAFQHRSIVAGMNILLTDYNNLYTRDLLLPAGDLRDIRASANRAQVIIVTKCSPQLTEKEKNKITDELSLLKSQRIFFTTLQYGLPYHLFSGTESKLMEDNEVLLVSGIANPGPLKELLATQVRSYDMLRYKDHHIFTTDDLDDIRNHFNKLKGKHSIILTTEKDGVRLKKFGNLLSNLPIFVIPVAHRFLFNEGAIFDEIILNYVEEKRNAILYNRYL